MRKFRYDPARQEELRSLTLPARQEELRSLRHSWLNTRGAVLYRAGRHASAVRQLNEAVAVHGTGMVEDWLFLSLAHQRLGHAAEAKKWLDRARGQKPSTRAKQFWENLEVDLLRREAEKVLKQPKR
jgi:hypothetical protein